MKTPAPSLAAAVGLSFGGITPTWTPNGVMEFRRTTAERR
jgi:hypothetical protein